MNNRTHTDTDDSRSSASHDVPVPSHDQQPSHDQHMGGVNCTQHKYIANNTQCAEAESMHRTPSHYRGNLKAARPYKQEKAQTWANVENQSRSVREYTLGEEIANSITHGIGALASIAALVLCVIFAVRDGGGILLFAALVYSISQFLEYMMSTLYHAITAEKAKRVFKVLDHSAIYIYIAGCYTPFTLVTLGSAGGVWLCIFVWAVALVGVAIEAFWVFRPRWISVVIYLLMGWCVVWYAIPLAHALAPSGLALLVASGLCFTAGCPFYVMKKIRYMHTVFHVWVLAGSVCMFFAIALYVL